jgi:hypothetical protein
VLDSDLFLLRARVVNVCTALCVLLAACDGRESDERTGSAPLSARDSLATAREIRASLSGDVAPGGQAYTYRGLYAGMPRARLEARVHSPANCRPAETPPGDLVCTYETTLGSDSAHVRVEAQLGEEDVHSASMARTLTVSRDLPLDVDGVRLAHALSDAFEAQTAMLDKRDASYGHQQARVRMGTVSGPRQNFVDLSVSPSAGRELLTVKMSRR